MIFLSVIAFYTFLWLATVADSITAVAVALIGAVASTANTFILTRDRKERNEHQAAVREAIDNHGLVAMVPEKIVEDVEKRSRRKGRRDDV